MADKIGSGGGIGQTIRRRGVAYIDALSQWRSALAQPDDANDLLEGNGAAAYRFSSIRKRNQCRAWM